MTDLTSMHELPPKNHNNPPSELELLKDRLELKHLIVIKKADEQIKFVAEKIPAVFNDDAEASFTADYIKMMRESQRILEKERKDEKEPFLRQGQFVDSFFKDINLQLEQAISRATAPLNDYLQRKANAEKLEREREAAAMKALAESAVKEATQIPQGIPLHEAVAVIERASDMAAVSASADKLAAVPVSTMASAAGKFSSAGLVETWVGTIKNKAELDLNALRPYIKDDALQVALNAFIKFGGRELAGAEIKKVMGTKIK